MSVMRRPVGGGAEGGAGAVLVEVLIMAPASGPHRAGRIPRGDTAGMNPPGPALLPEEDAGAGGGPGTGGGPNADPAARTPATGSPGPWLSSSAPRGISTAVRTHSASTSLNRRARHLTREHVPLADVLAG